MPRGQRETIAAFAAARMTRGYSSSRPASLCCFESLRRDRARRSESVSRSRSNRTAAATSGPASDPRPASSAPATKRRPNERSNANRRRPVRNAGALERADAARGPVGEEGLPDDPLLRDRTPFAAIRALSTIVAHHKKVPRRNRDLASLVADVAALIRPDERLFLLLAVDEHAPTDHLQAVARYADHALDEVGVRALRRRPRAGFVCRLADPAAILVRALGGLEHDDVPPVRIAEVAAHPVDEHPLAHVESRLHRLARDPEGLDDEGLDPKRQPERDRA